VLSNDDLSQATCLLLLLLHCLIFCFSKINQNCNANSTVVINTYLSTTVTLTGADN